MKTHTFIFIGLSFFINLANAQNFQISAIVVDKITRHPLQAVNIYNESNSSLSNDEGRFVFVSDKNEINLNLMGYNPIKTTFNGLQNQDSIFMEIKAIALDEVIVSNTESFVKKVYENLTKNYVTSSYTNNFFIRSVLKKENEIVKLQDLSGKKYNSTMIKTTPQGKTDKSGIEILSMRKIGVFDKKDNVDFKLPDFDELFDMPIFLDTKYVDLTEENTEDENYCKINFIAKNKDVLNQKVNGYVIINKKDYAITQYFISYYDDSDNCPYKKTLLGRHQYRTRKYQKTLHFSKNETVNKYYLNNDKLDCQLEILADKKIEKTFYYDLSINYFVTKNFTGETANANFPMDKDIFKAKFSYSDDFWKNQNQLPLTSELKSFIDKANIDKENKKEFEVTGNF